MARTDVTVGEISRAGIAETLIPAIVDGHMFLNGGDVHAVILNTDVAAKTITFITPRTVHGLAVGDLAITLNQNDRKKVGPFPPDTFNQPTGADAGKVYVDYSAITGVSIGFFRLGVG